MSLTTPEGLRVFTPNVAWVHQDSFQREGVRLDLYTSDATLEYGTTVWFQARLTNVSSSPVRLPRVRGGDANHSSMGSRLTKDRRTLTTAGDLAVTFQSSLYYRGVNTDPFFTLAPGATMTLSTESIRGYYPMNTVGAAARPERAADFFERLAEPVPRFTYHQAIPLQPGSYEFSLTFRNRSVPDDIRSRIINKLPPRPRNKEGKAIRNQTPIGTWRVESTITVISPSKND